jgi:hypothetical protein
MYSKSGISVSEEHTASIFTINIYSLTKLHGVITQYDLHHHETPKSHEWREQWTSSEFSSHYCLFTPNRVQMFRGVRPSAVGSIVTCVPHIGAHLPVSHPRSRIQNPRFPAAGLGPASCDTGQTAGKVHILCLLYCVFAPKTWTE